MLKFIVSFRKFVKRDYKIAIILTTIAIVFGMSFVSIASAQLITSEWVLKTDDYERCYYTFSISSLDNPILMIVHGDGVSGVIMHVPDWVETLEIWEKSGMIKFSEKQYAFEWIVNNLDDI